MIFHLEKPQFPRNISPGTLDLHPKEIKVSFEVIFPNHSISDKSQLEHHQQKIEDSIPSKEIEVYYIEDCWLGLQNQELRNGGLQIQMSFVFFSNNIEQVALAQRVEELGRTIQQLYQIVSDLTNRVDSLSQTNDQLSKALCENKQVKEIMTNPSYDDMIIDRIFSKKRYQFMLELKDPIKQPLYRERNFNLYINLVDQFRRIVPNSSRIQLKFALYTSAELPEPIQQNRQGEPIMKGNLVTDLINGFAQFQKISIRQVSSKFEKGIFYIIVSVHSSPFENSDANESSIKPLIIRDVIVKAKKI